MSLDVCGLHALPTLSGGYWRPRLRFSAGFAGFTGPFAAAVGDFATGKSVEEEPTSGDFSTFSFLTFTSG